MKYKVLIAGRYNNRLDQADDYAVDDVLETGTAYGERLAAKGYVEQIVEGEPETLPNLGEEEAKPAAPAARRSRKANPFTPEA